MSTKLEMLYNKELEKIEFPFIKDENIYRKRVIGDGSCYFHAIIDAYFLPIRTGVLNGERFDRFKFVKKFRYDLSNLLEQPRPQYGGKTYYETLSRGELSDRAKNIEEASLAYMKKLLRSQDSVSYIYHEFVSDLLNLDIYILDAEKRDVRLIDSDLGMYYKNRKSIILLYLPGHFELIGTMRLGELKTYFSPRDKLIKTLKRRLKTIVSKLEKD